MISVEGDCFQSYDSNAWSKALAPHAEGDLVLTSSSSTGRELASSIAAIRGIPVLQDATNISEGIVVSRPIYSGKVIETSSVKIPCVITLRANSYEASESSGNAEISTVNQTADVTISIRKALERAGEKIDVSEADIIISGGRGMGEPSNFSNLEEVADLLGAAVGASRAAVDTWERYPIACKWDKLERLSLEPIHRSGHQGNPTPCWYEDKQIHCSDNKDPEAQYLESQITESWPLGRKPCRH